VDLFPQLDDLLLAALYLALILISLFFFFVAMTTIWWQTHAWRTPEHNTSTVYTGDPSDPKLSFSVIMPCRDESEAVMRATLDRLIGQTHKDVQIIISLGHDDLETIQIARRLAEEHPGVEVSINFDPVKNKPRQLNTALEMCTGDIVGVFDAESLAAPELLAHIDATFMHEDADVVQGAVQLINFRDSWYSLRNCLEYFFWFRSRLHAQAQHGFIPLGGNTVFIRRNVLNEVGGWDGDCLAEDCDLGVRLSTLGHQVKVAYDPSLATREETPDSIRVMVKQRTRWALGFFQVYAKGDWRNLPTARMRRLAWWTLSQQTVMALAGLMIPISILTAILLSPPMWVTLILFLPMFPTIMIVAIENVALYEFGRDFHFKVRVRDYFKLTLSTPFYQMLLGFASARAMVKYHRGDFGWEKTSHKGAHLTLVESVGEAA
jgi:cellulose synthase/poly-beta-1,6-N-acetylglucosamine synthase-like glycosyltransferase